MTALESTLADLEAERVAQQDALAQSLLELVQLKERIGKRVDDEDAAAPLPQGRAGVRGRRQDIEGFSWLPSTEASQKQRRRRALWREVAQIENLPAKEEAVAKMQRESEESGRVLREIRTALDSATKSLAAHEGPYVTAYKKALAVRGIAKTAYFGHAYIGKYCKQLCTPEVALAITEPLLLPYLEPLATTRTLRRRLKRLRKGVREMKECIEGGKEFDSMAFYKVGIHEYRYADLPELVANTQQKYNAVLSSLRDDPEYEKALLLRQRWVLRFTKWGLLQRMLGGSVDFAANQWLVLCMRYRAASYGGFFAMWFNDVPTPKQYLTLTHGVWFAEHWGFCGFADEEPMESQHGDWKRRLARYIHCRDRDTALRTALRSLHVRNNSKVAVKN